MYDLKASRVLKKWKAHDSRTWSIDWSPEGERVATGSNDGGAAIWHAETGELIHRLMPNQKDSNKNYLRQIDWNPRHELVAVSHRDGYVRVFDGESGELKFKRQASAVSCNVCAWSADGEILAGGGAFPNYEIIFYSREGQRTGTIKTLARDGQWSPDGKWFATGSEDQDVTIWNVETKEVEQTLRFHSAPVKRLAWSPDSQRLVSVADDDTARVWNLGSDTAPLRVIHSGPAAARMVACSPDGRWIAGAFADKAVRVWDMLNGELVYNFDSHTADVKDLSWSADSQRIAAICSNNTVWLLDLKTGKSLRTITMPGGTVHPWVAWRPGTNQIALGPAPDRTRTYLYDARTGNILNEGSTPPARGRWSHDGQMLAQPNVMTVSNADLKPVSSFKLGSNECLRFRWSPNDRLLACGGWDGRLRVVDIVTQKVLGIAQGHGNTIYSVAWHPSGTRIASGGDDGRIILWDAATLDAVWSAQLPARVLSLDWSPDGKHLISSHGEDGQAAVKQGEPSPEVRIWGSPQITRPSEQSTMLNTAIAQAMVPVVQHREMATQILNMGGAVVIAESGGQARIKRLIDLPATPFQLRGIDLEGVAIDDTLLRELSTGLVISELNVRETGLTDDAVRDLVRSLRNVKQLDFDTSRREFLIDEDGKVTEVLNQQEELANLTLAIEQGPKLAHHRRMRAIWYGEHLQWEKACEDFANFHALNVSHDWGHIEAARAALMVGDHEAYQTYMQVNLGKLSDYDFFSNNSRIGAYLALTMVLSPETIDDWEVARKLAEQHHESDSSFYGTKGVAMVALRMEQPQRVVDLLDRFEPFYLYPNERVLYHALRALAQFQLGNKQNAQDELAKANSVATEQWTKPNEGQLPAYGDFNTYMEGMIFLGEARELIRPGVPVPTEATSSDDPKTPVKLEAPAIEQSLTDQQ